MEQGHHGRPSLVLRLLGPPLGEREGLAVEVKLRQAVALLAHLAVSGQRHSRDELAEMLFPHEERERGSTDPR
jgi:DNA-binding SARP family transcriptional activator